MSLRGAAEKRTICEVLREVCDLVQEHPHRGEIVPKLAEAERMAKKMIRKLLEYNEEADKDWWEKNENYKQDLQRRINETYISE